MLSTLARIMALAAAVLIVGCQSNRGVVTGGTAGCACGGDRDVAFVTPEGRHLALNQNRADLTILVFPNTPGCDCCSIDPQSAALADRYRNDRLSVVQVTQPSGTCSYDMVQGACPDNGALAKGPMRSICDFDHKARAAYGNPEPGAILLIDGYNRVLARGSVNNPRSVVCAADCGATAVRHEWEPSGD